MNNNRNFERFAVYILLFSASGASLLSRSMITWDNPTMPAAMILIGAALLYLSNTRISKRAISLMMGFTGYYLLILLKYSEIFPRFYLIHALTIFLTYAYLACLRERLFWHLEQTITMLAGLSLGLWLMDALSGGSVSNLLDGIYILEPYNQKIDYYLLVFTKTNEGIDSLLPRNSGFAWEPGAFAIYLCIGIFSNLLTYNYRIRGNWNLAILVAALLSTQSTTGYSLLSAMAAVFVFSRTSTKAQFIAIPIFLLVISGILSLPFMGEKISEVATQDLNQIASEGAQEWNYYSPLGAQRILSFKIEMMDFFDNPILGYGGNEREMLLNREAINVISTSGIGKIFSKFGLVGGIFFVYSLATSALTLQKIYGSASGALLITLVIGILISYVAMEAPILACFWMFGIFMNSNFQTRR